MKLCFSGQLWHHSGVFFFAAAAAAVLRVSGWLLQVTNAVCTFPIAPEQSEWQTDKIKTALIKALMSRRRAHLLRLAGVFAAGSSGRTQCFFTAAEETVLGPLIPCTCPCVRLTVSISVSGAVAARRCPQCHAAPQRGALTCVSLRQVILKAIKFSTSAAVCFQNKRRTGRKSQGALPK